jgi:hypothetical protein
MKKPIIVTIIFILSACATPQATQNAQPTHLEQASPTTTFTPPPTTSTAIPVSTSTVTPAPPTAIPLATSVVKPNVWTKIGVEVEDILALAIDPATPTTLYAVTRHAGVFKSADEGANWHAINQGLTNTEVQALAIDPATPDTIYVGTNGAETGSTPACLMLLSASWQSTRPRRTASMQ